MSDALRVRALEAEVERLEAVIEEAADELVRDAPRLSVAARLRGALNTKGRRWGTDEILGAIREWHRLYGEPPSAANWSTGLLRAQGREEELERFLLGRYPTDDTVRTRFGSFPAAVVAAGFEPVVTGQRRGVRDAKGNLDERWPMWTGWQVIGVYRERRGMNFRQLAERSHISYNHLRRMESGDQDNPTIRAFLSLARGLDVRASALLDE
jgi:hypothetical protein